MTFSSVTITLVMVLAITTSLSTAHVIRDCGPNPGAAYAVYNDTMTSIGWDILSIYTNASFADVDQAYAAGYVEGVATAQRICDHWFNMMGSFPNGTINPDPLGSALEDYFTKNAAWMDQMTSSNAALSGYWFQVNLVWQQFKGMFDGFSSTQKCSLTRNWLMSLGSQGDLFDLKASVQRTDWKKFTPREFNAWVARKSHCSGLIKVAADLSDLFFSHSSWYTYTSTTRIFKHYHFNYKDRSTKAKLISMSSYPASLSSFDDYHVMDNGMVSIETSIQVFDYSVYNNNTITPSSLLYWVRVSVANRMAKDSPDWAKIFAKYNSGTYNNQWMVLNLAKFTPGKDIVPDTLWVVEQMPGWVQSADQSQVLSYGYWPSYNVPSYPNIFNALGYPQAIASMGPDMLDYGGCSRANIFRRDQTNVKNITGLQFIMEYNDYEHDPFSKGNPSYAIASREDLDPVAPRCGGAYDNKVSSYSLWKSGQVIYARSGPTWQQPAFSFDATKASCGQHRGLPSTFNYDYVKMSP
eukprot:PhF_6_TR11704/c0_g1_i1/m.19030